MTRIGADGVPLEPGVELQVEQTAHQFLFGSNIFWPMNEPESELRDAYLSTFKELLNFATLPFYWWGMETRKGEVAYPPLRRMADWCLANGVRLKGHPLAWNYHDPAWLKNPGAKGLAPSIRRITSPVSEETGGRNPLPLRPKGCFSGIKC